MTIIRSRALFAALSLGLMTVLAACDEQGSAEKAGKTVDKAVEQAKETAKDTAATVEKKADEAAESAGKALDKAGQAISETAKDAEKTVKDAVTPEKK
jgi:hyperosmotically inducible protein